MKLKEAIAGKFVTLKSVTTKELMLETHVLDTDNELVVVYPFYRDALLMMLENDAIKDEYLIDSSGKITAIIL